jgi:AbiV family abortive infection protein
MDRKDLKCDLHTAREGCLAIANHVLDLIGVSGQIIMGISDSNQSKRSLKSAYILNLIALEETGKLFRLWKASAEAENSNETTISIEDFRNHEQKADIANSLLCNMLDYVSSELSSKDLDPLDRFQLKDIAQAVKNHRDRLSLILRNFISERENTMYVDYSKGKWTKEIWFSDDLLRLDCIILGVIADSAVLLLQEGCSFSLTVKALADLKMNKESIEASEFIEIVRRGMEKRGLELYSEND